MATTFTINGKPYTVDLTTLPPDITLNTFIREHAQLTATKFMCLEGGCGACVCVAKARDPKDGTERTWAVNSCLTLLNVCREWEIVTCEGIGNKRDGYHPIQTRLAKMNGTQCGFCSPGFVMNMYALMKTKGNGISMEEVEDSFGGNICRCTGYRPILDAMKSFAVDSSIKVPPECRDIEDLSEKICPKTGLNCAGSCHPLIPSLVFDDGSRWHWPKNLTELFDALQKVGDNEEFMLVAGNTAHGVYRRSPDIKHFIDVNGIPDLKHHSMDGQKLTLGANLSLTEAMEIFQEAKTKPGFEYCEELWHHFNLIANTPVRNTGTLAGNISIKKAHPEFPSDVFILFETLDAHLIVNRAPTTQQRMTLQEYLKSRDKKMVITAFELKAYPSSKFIFKSYKIMPRAQNSHAYVNAGFLFGLDDSKSKVKSTSLCFGGIRPDFVHASKVESIFLGKSFSEANTIETALKTLLATLKPDDVLPETSPKYRSLLACGLLYKFLLKINPSEKVKSEFRSGKDILKREISRGTQKFGTVEKKYPVTKPVHKIEGLIQCSGEATYMNDKLTSQYSGYCALVTATVVGATVEEIDSSEALKMPGVLAFYSAEDIPGKNAFFDKFFDKEDEELFCSGRVLYHDQPVGVIVATSSDIAHRAVPKVKIMYSIPSEDVYPDIDAVLASGKIDRVHCELKSPLEKLQFTEAAEIHGSGFFLIGSQYHFTMEPQTTIVVPFEGGLQVYCATQWMDHTQYVIANLLQMKASEVQLKVRRLGGAYGGKVSRGNVVACAASLAASKLNRPIRFVQTIESMMDSLGKRWACLSDYEFYADKNGKIIGLKNEFYEDAGCSINESPLLELSLIEARNCYDFNNGNYKLDGSIVVTDAPSATRCRGPGSVEGIAMIENIIEHIAFEAQQDPADVRLINIKPGNKLAEILPNFLKDTEYRQRRKEIENFNCNNRWRKRGLGLAIMDYSLIYIFEYPATVAIYHADGTVVVSHGGIEMGQGLNTKVAQVAAFTLGVPLEAIKIEASNTVNDANAGVTGVSIGSEVICYAVRKACNTLNQRLKPVKDSLPPGSTWLKIIQTAYIRQVHMIACEDFKVGDMQDYHIFGVGLTEMEVDILTGNSIIRRVDIFEDTGESLSPYIDIGQVEGAFVMGLGYWLFEKLVYDRQTGKLLTNRTWNYKTPGAKDIPVDFRVQLSQKYPNSGGFMSSKATGEPPTCLAVSSIFALRQAIESARHDAGLKREWVRLGAPTTPENIVLQSGSYINMFKLQ